MINPRSGLILPREPFCARWQYPDYDDDGNLKIRRNGVGDEELELHYDERNRVTSVDVGGTEVARYAYDPLGYRIEVDGSGPGVRRNLLDAEHLDAAYDEVGNPVATYMRGSVIDEVVNAYTFAATGKPTSYTYHHDALQSVVGLSGHAGTVEQTLRYGPFGELMGQAGSSPSALRFTGREFDGETGLYYYRARYYDPEIGRFLSEDPLGFDGGDVNLYAYVRNNPLNANDPMGHELGGLSIGVNVPLPFCIHPLVCASFTGNITVAAGRDPSANFGAWQFDAIATGELAGGIGDPFPSAFIRGVGSLNPSVVPRDLTGFAPSVTADALLLTGSVTFPRAIAEGDFSTRIYEFGLTTPSVDLDAAVGYGISIPGLIGSTFSGSTPPNRPSQSTGTPTFVVNSTK